jgi:hypothetical protein
LPDQPSASQTRNQRAASSAASRAAAASAVIASRGGAAVGVSVGDPLGDGGVGSRRRCSALMLDGIEVSYWWCRLGIANGRRARWPVGSVRGTGGEWKRYKAVSAPRRTLMPRLGRGVASGSARKWLPKLCCRRSPLANGSCGVSCRVRSGGWCRRRSGWPARGFARRVVGAGLLSG